jgi:NAD(P)-binding Rossmann-like domain
MVAEFAPDLFENGLWLDDQARRALSTPAGGRGSRQLGRRAVVVGAGIGGLAAAGALAQHFERVDIMERDGLATRSHPGPARRRIGTRMACSLAAFARSIRFSPLSRVISP